MRRRDFFDLPKASSNRICTKPPRTVFVFALNDIMAGIGPDGMGLKIDI